MVGGTPTHYSYALLRVTITDANEPKFEESHYDGELPKDSPVGRSVLKPVTLTWGATEK